MTKSASDPLVTVVIATYNRPDTLCVAVESVIRQSTDKWQLLIIGDNCNDETIRVTDKYSDNANIHFVNLSCRCGGQSLPNSAGVLVSNTDYVAFLNHDDIWFPDHLEIALKKLINTGSDFFVGRAAFAYEEVKTSSGLSEPVFTYSTPYKRTLRQGFSRGFLLFEPVSSWVIRTSFAKKVGAWDSAVKLYRVPIQDWIMRAWRAGARLISDERVTCLKLETHWGDKAAKKRYKTDSTGHLFVLRQFEKLGGNKFREDIEQNIEKKRWDRLDHVLPSKRRTARRLEKCLRFLPVSELYYRFGVDTFTLLCHLLDIGKGDVWKKGLRERTGESISSLPTLDSIVNEVEAKLSNRFR